MSRAEILTGTGVAESGATPRELVDRFQRDLLRLAFVLTGSGAVALYLTRDVLLDVLTGMDPDDEEIDPQNWSLLQIALGRRYILGAEPEGQPGEPVDEDRARLREAVELLSRPMRTALVLRDLGGLNERDIAAITGIEIDDLEDVLAWSRERLREAARHLPGQPPARILASLAVDAPRDDLWPDIAPIIEERETRRRRRTRQIVVGVLAAVLLFAAGSVIWLLDVPFYGGTDANDAPEEDIAIIGDPPPTRPPLPTATPAPTPTSIELIDAALGSGLQIWGYLFDDDSRGTGERVMFAFDSGAEQPLVEVEAASYSSRYVSLDGRWTVLFHRRTENLETDDPDDDTTRRTLSATLDGEDMGWEYLVPPSALYWDYEIAGDRLYVLTDRPEPVSITALDLQTGEVAATRTLDVAPSSEGNGRINVYLFVAPEAVDPALYAFVTRERYGDEIRNEWVRWLYRIDPDDLQPRLLSSGSVTAAEVSGENDAVVADFWPWEAHVLPDNTGLYVVKRDGQQMGIEVLDFESSDIESFSTSFSTVPDYQESQTFLHRIISNDGRKLYIFSQLTGEVAVIDLPGRRVERTFPLDLAGLRRDPIEIWSLHLSHDGRRLYVVEDTSPYSQSRPPESHPVWVVDLTTWRVERRIEIPGYIQSLYPDPDGQSLHVVSHVEGSSNPERWRFQLLTYDTEDWELAASQELSDLIEQPATFRLLAISDTYRNIYGHTPVIDGIEPEDVEDYTTLPWARVVTEDGRVPVGATRMVELEFLDPATGEPLTRADPRVRYDPDEPVTLVFERPGAKSLVTVAAELGPGHQRGTVRLKEAGLWDARIIAGDEDSGFTLILPDVLRGTPAFEADNGHFYDLRLETSPEILVGGVEILFRASFVDATTGEPLPEGVALLEGLPETLRLALVGTGALNRNLDPAGHGVYEATVTFSEPGPWQARLIFRQPLSEETRSTQIEMGTLDVAEASP